MSLRGRISISILLIEKPCCESLLCNRSSSSQPWTASRDREREKDINAHEETADM